MNNILKFDQFINESINEAKITIGTFVRYKKDKDDFTGGKIKSINGNKAEIHNWDGSTVELPISDLEYVKSWNESIDLDDTINESRKNEIGLLFTDKEDYIDFKEMLKDEGLTGMIKKDFGKSKPTKDTGWYVNVDFNALEDFYGNNWISAIKGDFPSVVIS